MKQIIKGKTCNTETSKKVCGYVVNDWTYELYQSKTGVYFTYYYMDNHYLERIRLVSDNEVSHMMERSGFVSGDKKVTVLNELKEWFSDEEENEFLRVTGEGGIIHFDYGSWEVTLDIDDQAWAKMTSKGKSDYNDDDLDKIERIRTDWSDVKRVYLNERYGETI